MKEGIEYKKFENAEQIIEELKKMNNLPIGQIESELSKLRMYYKDWQYFTDTEVTYTHFTAPNERDNEMLKGNEYMSYEDFIRLGKYRQITIPGRADCMQQDFEQYGIIPKEKVEQAKEIKKLWNELEIKKNPIEKISKYTYSVARYVDDMEYTISENPNLDMMKYLKQWNDIISEQIETIQRGFKYVKEKYGDTEKVNEAQINLINSLNKGQGILIARINGEQTFSEEVIKEQTNEIYANLNEYKLVCEEPVKDRIKEQQKIIDNQKGEIKTQKNEKDKGVGIDE